MKIHRKHFNQRGLTLLELLVVLSILAVLATVALTSSSGLADQARYEATQRTLENIREAVLGPANLRDTKGTLIYTGFVADTGRLPQQPQDALLGSPITLDELINPHGIQPYAVRQASNTSGTNVVSGSEQLADEDVYLGSGWRGPYLQLPPGQTEIRDGWGYLLANPDDSPNPVNHLLNSSGGTADVGDPISQVWSFGRDNAADQPPGNADPYDNDLSEIIKSTDYQATIKVPVTVQFILSSDPDAPAPPADGSTVYVSVSLFSPDPSGLLSITTQPAATSATVASSSVDSTILYTAKILIPLSFDTTCGPRALRAYYYGASVPSTMGPTASSVVSSAVVYLNAVPGLNISSLNIPVILQ
ncbi:MAG: prepilin-type N-terminal cleavage/methylation domain-containing protein [Prosthecobacter sp.]